MPDIMRLRVSESTTSTNGQGLQGFHELGVCGFVNHVAVLLKELAHDSVQVLAFGFAKEGRAI